MLTRNPLVALALCFVPSLLAAQNIGVPEKPLPDRPFVIDTAEAGQVRVTPLKGLELPWDLAFLPNGDMLVTERTAMRLRIVRNSALVAEAISGLPEGMSSGGGGGFGVPVPDTVPADGLCRAAFAGGYTISFMVADVATGEAREYL